MTQLNLCSYLDFPFYILLLNSRDAFGCQLCCTITFEERVVTFEANFTFAGERFCYSEPNSHIIFTNIFVVGAFKVDRNI